MIKILTLTCALILGPGGPALAQFVGNLILKPDGCENIGVCTLGESFGFIDSRDVGWEAKEGNLTDGASIPQWAQKFAGVPFTRNYVPASVLHDHYSKSNRPVRGWLETQRMFYEALIASEVPEAKASILFAGVLIGSGKWITRMEGQRCSTGIDCIQQTVKISLEKKDPIFGTEDYTNTFSRVAHEIEIGGIIGIDNVEELVRSELPEDIYLQNPSGVIKKNINFGALATE